MFNELPIVCGGSVIVFVLLCITCVHSSFAIILKRKRKLVGLNNILFNKSQYMLRKYIVEMGSDIKL